MIAEIVKVGFDAERFISGRDMYSEIFLLVLSSHNRLSWDVHETRNILCMFAELPAVV